MKGYFHDIIKFGYRVLIKDIKGISYFAEQL
jgi:hypothetical protein